MKGTIEMRQQVMDLIDEQTLPGKMNPEEAIAHLEELSADIDGRIMALKEENELE